MLSDNLNAWQSRAVHYNKGPLLILTVPGSGKIFKITEKVVHLIEEDIPPERILELTFSEKALGEMQERIEKKIGMGNGIDLATLHSFCNEPISQFSLDLGIVYGTRLLSREHCHVGAVKNTDDFVLVNNTSYRVAAC